MPATEPLFALEEALGGFTLGEPHYGLELGFARVLEARGMDPGGTERVAFAGWGGDGWLLVDAAGQLSFVDDIDGTDAPLAWGDAERIVQDAAVWRLLERDALGAILARREARST